MPNGWKNWAALETVTEPDFQGYLQDQVVMRFANAAARDAALGANTVEGMMCWLQDVDWLQIYRSAQWRPVATMRQGHGVNSTAQDIASGTWTKVNIQSFSPPANAPGRAVWTTDGRVRVPFSGAYLVQGQVAYPANDNGQRVAELRQSADGNTWTRSGVIGATTETAAAVVNTVTLSISGTVELSANQYISLWTYQDSGESLKTVAANSGLSVLLLGAD